MLNRFWIRASVVSAVFAGLSMSVAQAGLFDRLKPRPTADRVTRRAQSPEPVAAPAVGSWQAAPLDGTATPWYTPAAPSTVAYGDPQTYCCGPEDRNSHCTVHCRKKCDQTYYTPVPPYCYPCFGVSVTCWKRLQECSICPREPAPTPPRARRPTRATLPKAAPPDPALVPPVPAEPVEPPEPMDDEDDKPAASRQRAGTRTAHSRSEQSSVRPAARSQWTGYADALPADDEIPEAPLDTLDEQVAEEEFIEQDVEETGSSVPAAE